MTGFYSCSIEWPGPGFQVDSFPSRIKTSDKLFLFRATPAFQLFLAGNGLLRVGENFEVDKQVGLVATNELVAATQYVAVFG